MEVQNLETANITSSVSSLASCSAQLVRITKLVWDYSNARLENGADTACTISTRNVKHGSCRWKMVPTGDGSY